MEGGDEVRFRWSSPLRAGRPIEVRACPPPMPDGGIGVLFAPDTGAEQEQLEGEVGALRARLWALPSEMPDRAMVTLDAAGVITGRSEATTRLLGWSEAEAVGQTADLLLPAAAREGGLLRREIAEARRMGRHDADAVELLRADGAAIRCRNTSLPPPDGFPKPIRPTKEG
jgi:PAS domain S-box-containing protein